jgi:hypothetical protein
MALTFLFDKRIRGFRVVEIVAFLCLTVLVFGVYFTKAHAGHETAEITDVNQQIGQTERRLRLLNAELAHLESPARLENLSQQYLAFAPINARHEAAETGLMEIARQDADAAQAKGKASPAALAPVAAGAATPAPKPAGAPL